MRLIDADALMELYADRLTVVAERYSPDSSECGILSGAMKLLEIQPTIEERKTGKWVSVKDYCDHLNEEAEREGKGNRYIPSGMNISVYCNQCWEPNDRQTTYCPNCGAKMEKHP